MFVLEKTSQEKLEESFVNQTAGTIEKVEKSNSHNQDWEATEIIVQKTSVNWLFPTHQ